MFIISFNEQYDLITIYFVIISEESSNLAILLMYTCMIYFYWTYI